MPIGQRNISINDEQMKLSRQEIMLAPFGSFRLRIEFYKQVIETVFNEETQKDESTTYLKDVGIGFYGTAQFTQITGNHRF